MTVRSWIKITAGVAFVSAIVGIVAKGAALPASWSVWSHALFFVSAGICVAAEAVGRFLLGPERDHPAGRLRYWSTLVAAGVFLPASAFICFEISRDVAAGLVTIEKFVERSDGSRTTRKIRLQGFDRPLRAWAIRLREGESYVVTYGSHTGYIYSALPSETRRIR